MFRGKNKKVSFGLGCQKQKSYTDFFSVCWDEKISSNSVWGMIDRPEFEDRPRTFYFGDFGDDVDR